MLEQISPSLPTVLIVSNAEFCTHGQRQRDIFDSHRHHVYSIAYYMTGDELEAEKILEATFIRTFRAGAGQPDLDQIDNALLAELAQRFSLASVLEAAMPAGELDGISIGNVRRTELEEALWGLPDTERLFFLLRDVEGYSPERIAGLVARPVAAVRQTLHAARLLLRRQLSMHTAFSA
ncbi:MAG TPA: RNA polymerase sigma factor [Acidobacteriaceae bacterium]|nr:RNA polymerase sigma factor [Acidobacteriaceae bacterium]